MKLKYNRWDVYSLGLIVFFSLLQIPRFYLFPQFIDEYYHLYSMLGFDWSGGWVGWDYWEFAPWGRPHLYPPFYHFLLLGFYKLGIDKIFSLKLVGFFILPFLFICLWKVLSEFFGKRFGFFSIFLLSSSFPVYSCITTHIPASFALIFGFFGWLALKRKRLISATLFLGLSFYTHAGIPWIFLLSLIFFAVIDKGYRKFTFKLIFLSLIFAFPMIFHQLRYVKFIRIVTFLEAQFMRINPIILLLAALGVVFCLRRKGFYMLLIGFAIGSYLIFFKYPYRYFTSQGMISLIFLSALFLEVLYDFF